MKKWLFGVIVATLAIAGGPPEAQAGQGWVAYQPGVVKAALANGGTALLFYKSTW